MGVQVYDASEFKTLKTVCLTDKKKGAPDSYLLPAHLEKRSTSATFNTDSLP